MPHAFPQAKEVVVKVGTVAPQGTPWSDELYAIKKRVEQESNKTIKFKVYLGGQLGGENEILQGIIRGRIQGGGLTATALAAAVPELDLLEVPYLFESSKQADCVLDNHLLEPFRQLFDAKGLVFVTWAENGWRNIGTKNKPIRAPADLKGVKIRAQESKVHLAYWKNIGASAVPIAVPEVLPALQTGVVEGFDQTALMTLAAEWQTAIKYYTVTEHIYQPAAIVYSKAFFDSLSEEHKKILMGNGNGMAPRARSAVRRLGAQLIKSLEANNVQIIKLSAAEKAAFKNAAAGIADQMVSKIGGQAAQIYAKIKAGKAACKP
ncbi:MAG: TRAP transporter substrate-binding protein DctP [Turneriella sp.]|nr:TRAP transporter substrate-binding protein DctP [Turneriella sp.]